MTDKYLLILDIEKNFDLREKNVNFISLNKGLINFSDCKQIFLNDYQKQKKKYFKILLRKLKELIYEKKKFDFFLVEQEIFNLRNDKYNFIDKILNFLVIRYIISKKKIKKIKIISDNKNTFKVFKNLDLEIDKVDLSIKRAKRNFIYLKILKFYLKALFVVIFIKLRKKENVFNPKKDFFMSVFPNKFDYSKRNFSKENIFNFLLTDETHLNHNIFQICKNIKITEKKNILNIESLIPFTELILLILKNLFFFNENKNKSLNEIYINDLNLKNEINEFFSKSYINRSKLEIYKSALPTFLKKFDVKKIHTYLFEYNFGFFLIRNIRDFKKKIKILGYQHGIFTKNLYWFDLILSLKYKKKFLPSEIYSLNNYSLIEYKSKLKNLNIKFFSNKPTKNFNLVKNIKIKKSSNNLIVFPGTHDVKDIYFFFKNQNKLFNNKKIYFKLHPKNKFNFKEDNKIRKIENIKNLNYSHIIVSQTSSLTYDFLKMNRKFWAIDFDYKDNLLSSNIIKKSSFISRKKINDKKINFKI